MLKLLNTIEISPYDYSKEEYECPNGSSAELPSEWNSYWLKCITDSNLGALRAIKEGSYFVDMETIDFPELEEIIKKELSEVEFDDFEEQISRLSGGIVVKIGGEVVTEPSCCADVGDLENWEGIFTSEVNVWHQLWIGHPWVLYRISAGTVEFSDYTDSNPDDLEHIAPKYSISKEDLALEVRNSREKQEAFGEKILLVLKNMNIKNAAEITKLLLGNK